MSNYLCKVIDPLELIKGAGLTELKNKIKNYKLSSAKVSCVLAAQRENYGQVIPECFADS